MWFKKGIFFGAAIIASLGTICAGHAQESAPIPERIVYLTHGFAQVFRTSTPFNEIRVADEKLVHVDALNDRDLVMLPLGDATGATNVLVIDAGQLREVINVVISQDLLHPANAKHDVTIRNDPFKLNGATTWRCAVNGCVYVTETENVLPTERVDRRVDQHQIIHGFTDQ
jgi:hypothetical protein